MPLSIAREGSFEFSTDELLASAARTASGQSDQYATYGPVTAVVIEVNVTAVSGTTPTLDVDLEDTFDGTTWNKVSDINAADITATGVTVKRINLRDTPCTNRLRIKYTIGGTTPSFTFTVKAHFIRA